MKAIIFPEPALYWPWNCGNRARNYRKGTRERGRGQGMPLHHRRELWLITNTSINYVKLAFPPPAWPQWIHFFGPLPSAIAII